MAPDNLKMWHWATNPELHPSERPDFTLFYSLASTRYKYLQHYSDYSTTSQRWLAEQILTSRKMSSCCVNTKVINISEKLLNKLNEKMLLVNKSTCSLKTFELQHYWQMASTAPVTLYARTPVWSSIHRNVGILCSPPRPLNEGLNAPLVHVYLI